jgi:hypothetical protein
MAERQQGSAPARTTRRRKVAEDEERGATKRVVLRRSNVLVLPDGVTADDMEKIRAALTGTRLRASKAEAAWIVVGEFEGSSKDAAIKAHAGEPNTPDAKPGAFKAPSVSAWKGASCT